MFFNVLKLTFLIVLFSKLKLVMACKAFLEFISIKDFKGSKEDYLQNDKLTICFEVFESKF